MEIPMCNSYVEVNLSAIKDNIAKIRERIGGIGIMAVLKGNAYGMGLGEIAVYITQECGIDHLAAAQVAEAVKMRNAGISVPILVMGGVPFNNIPAAVGYNISTPAYNMEYLNLLNSEAARQNKKAAVHIKIETGLNRIGVKPGEALDNLCRYLKGLGNIEVVGIYTHFSEADEVDKSFSHIQMELFDRAVAQAKEYFNFTYIHSLNSAAAVWHEEAGINNYIRPAALIFGLDPNVAPFNSLGLTECMSWHTFITDVKEIEEGEAVGYNRSFIAPRKCTVATFSTGYGDGFPRGYVTNRKAQAIFKGKRVNIVSTCMDQSFADVTGTGAKINDVLTLMGDNGGGHMSPFEIQKRSGQNYLTALCTIAERVKRIYIR